MPMTSNSEREAMAAIRSAVARLAGPQAPIVSTEVERLQFMRRHFGEIERDIRYGLAPAPTHLSALAAHCVVLYMSGGSDA